MSLTWAEILAIFLKECRTEWRTRHGLNTAGLFCLVASVAIGLSAQNVTVPGGMLAGLVWTTLMFAAVSTLPRVVLAEDEQRTGDLLRLSANPGAVFWGKALFGLVLLIGLSLITTGTLVAMTHSGIRAPLLYAATLCAGCFALSGAVTLCGAIVSASAGGSALAGAITLPLVMPIAILGVAGMKPALGEGFIQNGWMGAAGLAGYALLSLVIGPQLYSAVWKT